MGASGRKSPRIVDDPGSVPLTRAPRVAANLGMAEMMPHTSSNTNRAALRARIVSRSESGRGFTSSPPCTWVLLPRTAARSREESSELRVHMNPARPQLLPGHIVQATEHAPIVDRVVPGHRPMNLTELQPYQGSEEGAALLSVRGAVFNTTQMPHSGHSAAMPIPGMSTSAKSRPA